jgi:outer membrane murein-binding lipoprotein Lpp
MAMTNAERQAAWRKRRGDEMERLRASSGGTTTCDGEVQQLRAEIARLQGEVAQWRAMAEAPSRPAAAAPHSDADELRRQVKRLRKEVDGLRAQHGAMCDDGTLLRIMRRAERMAKSVPDGGEINPKWLLKDIHAAIAAELDRRRKACATIDRRVEKLAAIAPDKATELRRKIEMLANDPGATDDERAAAVAALARLTTGVQ